MSNLLIAQTINDTINIDEIIISSGSISRFQAGAKIEKLPTKQIELLQAGSLESLLSRYTPIAIKVQGGGFSTIRVRGTSPNHTSINFGGIDLNSLTLGHANISNFPLYLFDEIGIQYGSSSAVNGSGNIGGAVHLGLKSYWVDGFKMEFRAAHGSFGEQMYGTKLYLGNGKFESVTRAYYYYKTNDFTFINPNYRDFENEVFEIEDTQQRANIENYGIIQEFNYRFATKETLKIITWLADDWHNIQPNMGSNLTEAEPDPIENENIRIWSEYNNTKHKLHYTVAGGYVYDYQVINNNYDDAINTQRIIGEANIEHQLPINASYKIGTKAYRIFPTVYAYSSSLIHEDRVDLYASYQQHLFNKLKATLNIRKGFVTGFQVPLTPSVGLAYVLLSREQYIFNLTGNVAKSYRVASFNDRYWDQPGFKGNPDIRPESGINYELGAKWSYCSETVKSDIKFNAFYMDIDDWILWKPVGAIWTAENVERVVSKGVEFVGNMTQSIGKIQLKSGLNYSLTSTQRVEILEGDNTEALNRQLEYVPLHSANIYSSITIKRLTIGVDALYRHWQFTDQTEKNIIDEYVLLNSTVKYPISFKNNNVLIMSMLFNNILNKNYISTYNYAMPRFNYQFSLAYKFK